MAFKMKGNPFPKKNGGSSPNKQLDVELENIINKLKENRQSEYDAEYNKQFAPRFDAMHDEEFSQVTDSLNLAGSDLYSKYQEGQEEWNKGADGNLTGNQYKALIDAYNKHINERGSVEQKRASQIDDIVNKKLNAILNQEIQESKFGQNLSKKYEDLFEEKSDSITDVANKYIQEFDKGDMTKGELKKLIGEKYYNQIFDK